MGKRRSLGRVGLAYLVALAGAALWLWLVPSTGRLWLDALLADVVGTLIIFLFSRRFRNSSFYDAYWSVVPVLLLAYWWTHATTRNWLLAAVVVVWAVRLTANWIVTFPGLHHEDWRYPLLRGRAGRFEVVADLVGIHLVPTLQVFLAMVPAYVALTTPDDGVTWLAWLAFGVGLAAAALELVADLQLRRFARTKQEGQVMDQGLWGWSRHPNYFGEFGFWFAVALFGVAASPGDAWWLFTGVTAILAMFLGASIPMMEARSLERRPAYQDVVDRVSRFVPRPPRSPRAAPAPRPSSSGPAAS